MLKNEVLDLFALNAFMFALAEQICTWCYVCCVVCWEILWRRDWWSVSWRHWWILAAKQWSYEDACRSVPTATEKDVCSLIVIVIIG